MHQKPENREENKTVEYPEEKSLRWLANMFPMTVPAKDNTDRMCNAIHTYSSNGADKIHDLAERIRLLTQICQANNLLPKERKEREECIGSQEIIGTSEMSELENYEYCSYEGWECNTWWLERDAGVEHEDTPDNAYTSYEIIFYVNDVKYSCCIHANSMDEALGIFFVNNPHITYDMIFEHEES